MPHINEKIDFVADVFIVYRDKVFLRMHDKHHVWLSVGGHIELDEDPVATAIREAKEESGLDVELVGTTLDVRSDYAGGRNLLPPRYMNIHNIGDNHKHISMVYFARAKTDKISPSGDDASHQWRWLTMEELDKNELSIKEPTLSYAKAALKELGE